MQRTLMFTVPGTPIGKGRPRFVRATGRTYTPEKTARYENWVRVCYMQQVSAPPFEANIPLSMTLEVHQQIPKSVSKRNREAMLNGTIFPTKKPDCSNILKSVEDGLNGVAYNDDSQIVIVKVIKKYSESPKVYVYIRELK